MNRLSAFALPLFYGFIAAISSISASAQTVTLNDGAIVQSNTNRVGVNIGAIDFWDQGQILKNLIGSSNPGMEPLLQQQIWALPVAGTSTSFTVPDIYDGVPTNYWTGGTFSVIQSQSGGAELGCTGTIASNTGPNYPLTGQSNYVAPVITVSTPCAAPFSAGDVILMVLYAFPTPESWWENGGHGGTEGTVRGGGKLLSDTTDLCATCGKQALNMDASVAGSSAQAAWYYDGENVDDIFVLMNGTYQVSFWAKAASGSPVLNITANRGSTGGFNCGNYSPSLTSTWALYTWNCTATETQAGTTPSSAGVSFIATGGSVYLDNVSFARSNSNQSNTTVLRDEVISTLQTYYGTSIGSNPGTLRYWVNQNAETISNWTEPDYAHGPTGWGTGYFVGPGGSGQAVLSLEDYLEICKYLNAEPYLEVPVTLSTADAANLVEFLGSPSTTTFGARRAALGQDAPWTSVFSKVHLAFCNECWNVYFPGQSLGPRTSAPNLELYYDYSVRARDIFAAMRADSYYSESSLDLVMGAQTAGSSTMDTAIQRAHPDSIEIEDYTYGDVSVYTPDSALWGPAMFDPWEKVTNPHDIRNFYQSVHDYQSQTTCGATGTATCKVTIYEWGQGTISGGLPQQYLDYVNAGAGEGVVMALQPLLNMQYYDIVAQSFFALTEYKNGASAGLTAKLWGNTIDMGGATNNVRPTFLGVQLINQSIIGPMYSCPINNNVTYNFPGSPNGVGAMPAMNNVPYLYAFCFENGTKRSLVLINTDLSSSHTLTFGGINPPSGTVTQRQYAPSALDDMNEAPTGTATNLTKATVAIETSSLSSPSSITLPPFSATALDYISPGAQAAAMPTFSPAAGTYTTTQQVTIGDTTPGTTIYYTTNGTTPTTSSTVFGSSPITVSANETLEAIAVETGYTTSPATTAAYIIAPVLPTPTFSPAAGTYATTQSVTISESATGTTVYYTTNGTTPTTSSSVYSGGTISVSTTETLNAIAVKAGFTNSVTGTVLYTIAPALPAPTFSPTPGTFTAAQSVTMSEATSGALIYYTTDGTTPTASSAKYGGAIWVAANETFKAIAIKSGNTNSAVVTGAYTIAPVLGTPTFSPTAGTYSGAQMVSFSDVNSGCTFYYTTNGTTPTTSSTKYTGAITVSANETLEVIAVETNYTNSTVGTATYTINSAPVASAPTFSVAAGTYTTAQSVIMSDATSGTTIYYTTNGTTPSTSSTKYAGAITVSTSETIEAIAVETGYNNSSVSKAAYIIGGLPAPTFSPAAGTYATAQSVTISDTTTGTTIYYTTNGTAPSTSSTKYTGAITVSATETLEAIAVESGSANSAVTTALYTIVPALPAPAFSPTPGTFTAAQSVTMSESTSGAIIYYTTDGTTPTSSSTMYGGAIWVSANETFKAIAIKSGNTNSAVTTGAYKIAPVLATPAFSPATGIYSGAQAVTVSDANSGSTFYYTTNGTTPTTSSTKYTGAITVSANETLQAIAVETNYTNSAASTATYTIDGAQVVSAPTFNLAAGTYTTAQSVSMSDKTAGATIYYTTNGTTPSTSSTKYTGAITVSAPETLEAIAVETGYNNSSVSRATYVIGLPAPTFSPAVGTYATAQSVAISDAIADTTIFYTTNGTTPSTSSTKYTGAIKVSATETLRAIGVKTSYSNSPAASATYTINPVVPAPTFSPAAGTYGTAQSITIRDTTLGTTIYYTTNGSTPTTSSTKYTGPITVDSTETLEAIAVETGDSNAVGTATYTIASAILTPTPGMSFTGISETFTWTSVSGATGYILSVGTTGAGSYNLYYSGSVTATSASVSDLPNSGGTVYVRLTTNFNGTWVHADYTYTAGTMAALTAPAPGHALTGSSATFTWTPITTATGYLLSLGSTGAGSYNLYYSGALTATSVTVNALPTNGETIYARLTTNFNGIWLHIDYTYTAAQ
jgi:hypothetical protein